MSILLFGKEVYVPAFIVMILCFLVFTTESIANVLIEGDSAPLTASNGDTVSLVARTRLNYGENLIKWEIVSGQGKFIDETADSTGFILSADDVIIRMVTQELPIYELTEQRTKYNFDKNSVRVPRSRSWGGDYGIRFYFDVQESGQYAQISEIDQSIGVFNIGTDSTFKTNDSRTCFNQKCFFTAKANTKHYTYIYASGYPNVFMKDSVFVRLSKTYSISASHTGEGTVFVDSANKVWAIDSASVTRTYTKVIDNDSVKIYAKAGTNNAFDHWEKVSGSCVIENDQKDTTRIMSIHSDCKVKAVFRAGTVYPISSTPTQYNFVDHIYAKNVSSGAAGVRFLFTAPSAGTYAIVVSSKATQDSAKYIRYTATDYKTASVTERFLGTYSETLTLTAGQEVAIVIANTGKDANPFYINYATQAYKITLSSDGNGHVLPAGGYTTAYTGSRYSISAEASSGYRFSNWQTVSGTPTIEDANDPYTFVTIKDNVELKAQFKSSAIYTLSNKKQTFNFLQNYYSESTHSEIRFTWTPPDTNSYAFQIAPSGDINGIFKEYDGDKTFTTTSSESSFSEASSFIFRGTPGVPLYWVIRDSSNNIPNTSFSVWISSPYILNIKSATEGATNPSGKVYTSPGVKNIITAWPHGGYTFKSWVDIDGDMTITDPQSSRTTVILKDSVCTIKATFKVDKAAEPSLNISKLDISNYPEICAQVSVTDKNTGSSFYGLVSDDFVLTQDGEQLQPQVTSINNVTGVSVVIVVDQSNSMQTNKRMDKAKDAIRSFVNNMGPYDRTAIVGFVGNVYVKDPSPTASDTAKIKVDSTIVHQAMTSNKTLLLNSIDGIKAVGGSTNIITGTYIGVQQIVNETNATAVIVFSDGDNNSGTTNLNDVINLAQQKNTPIYSIGLETNTKYPLENLATSTGGTFSLASDANELGGLYAAIRDNVMSQYVVCFQTPDTTQNGETHDVVIGMTFNKIKTSDTAQWDEKAIPPIITLTEDTWDLINHTQASNTPLTIGVYIRSPLNITSANLYVRASNSMSEQFTTYTLQHVRDSLWTFTIPANIVVAPGLDFYVTASDELGQLGKAPKITTPSMEPYTIFIDNDIPNVEVASVACEDSTKDTKTFSFRLSDSDGIGSAILYFRDSKQVIFDALILSYSDKNDTWTAEIPANVRDYTSIDYYLRVTDLTGATIRYPGKENLNTDACEIRMVIPPEDTAKTDPIPEDSILPPSPRDSIEYSLFADTAEIYDRNLDGRADFVRVHFKEENDSNITSIDSIFWNSNQGELRYVPKGTIKKSKKDGKWYEAYINSPYKYGLTKADTLHKPFLSFTSILSDKVENVKLSDKVGAVPTKAIKYPGKVGLEEYMDPDSRIPPDTLIVRLSEPITNIGKEEAWKNLFRYSTSCKDTASQPLKLKEAPKINDNGQQWTLILEDYSLKAGYCLSTNPSATYEDLAGNSLGRGGIEVDGKDGSIYLSEVKPVKPVSGKGKNAKWIPPKASDWEDLPDSISAISVKTMKPYKAEVYIFDGIGTYVTDFNQKFGYDDEMDDPIRGNSNDKFKQSYLHWDQRSKQGRLAGTGVYIWKINFKFKDGHKETRNVKTGIYRKGDKKKKKK